MDWKETLKKYLLDPRVAGAILLIVFVLTFGGIALDLYRFKRDQREYQKKEKVLQEAVADAETKINELPRFEEKQRIQQLRIGDLKERVNAAKTNYKQAKSDSARRADKPIIPMVGPLADPDNDIPGIPSTESVCTKAEKLGVPCIKFNQP